MLKISRALMIPALFVPRYIFTAFNTAGWKMAADGKTIEMKDGNPIWVDANGGESVMEGGTITRLNGEIKKHRERVTALETDLAPFAGLDAKAAKEAIEMVSKIDKKKLIDAGEVDRVTNEIKATFQGQLTEAQKVNADLQVQIDNRDIDGVFTGSDFVRDQVAIPADMFQAYFRSNFKKGKDGKIEAYDKMNNRIVSKQKVGEYAEPAEALQILVEQHPQKDTILRAPNASGGGGGGGGNRHGKRVIPRAEFDKMLPAEQQDMAKKAGAGEVVLTD